MPMPWEQVAWLLLFAVKQVSLDVSLCSSGLMVSTLNRISSSARSHLFENLYELLGYSDFITSPESSHYQQMKFTTKSSQNASHVTSHKHLIFKRTQCTHKPQASNLPKNTVHTLCLLHYKERIVERDKGLHATTVEAWNGSFECSCNSKFLTTSQTNLSYLNWTKFSSAW